MPEFYSDECHYSNGDLIYLIFGTTLSTSVVTAIISMIFTAVIMRLCSEVKCRKSFKTTSLTYSHDRSLQNVAGPLYEEVELANNNWPLNFSQNVAYQSALKK